MARLNLYGSAWAVSNPVHVYARATLLKIGIAGSMAATGKRLRDKLGRFIVPALEETGRSLGRGAYGEVVEMIMGEQRVAVKKIHTVFIGVQGQEANLAKFEEECIRYIAITT